MKKTGKQPNSPIKETKRNVSPKSPKSPLKTEVQKQYTPKAKHPNAKKYDKRISALEVIDEQKISHLRDTFELFVKEGTDEIDCEEFRRFVETNVKGVDDILLRDVIDAIDANSSGTIDFEEFVDLIVKPKMQKDSRAELEQIFRIFTETTARDDDKIGIEHIKYVLEDLDLELKDEEIEDMIEGADIDKDGLINFDEFYNIITKRA